MNTVEYFISLLNFILRFLLIVSLENGNMIIAAKIEMSPPIIEVPPITIYTRLVRRKKIPSKYCRISFKTFMIS